MSEQDLTSSMRGLVVGWIVPAAALLAAIPLSHPAKTLVWTAALVWMGIACLANARRCRRTHCYFTGPFFMLVAALTLLHGFDVIPLGAQGWRWLGLTIGAGAIALWCGSEAVLGKYRPAGDKPGPDR